MSGPCGGVSGAPPRGGKGPGQRRMLLKGLRMGAHVFIAYKEKQGGPGAREERNDFEGTIVDKRVGWDNRESYVELKECIRLNADKEIIEEVGKIKLIDAFIEDVQVIEKEERAFSAELLAQQKGQAPAQKKGAGKKKQQVQAAAPAAAPPAHDGGDDDDSDDDDDDAPKMPMGMMGMMPGMGMGMMPGMMMPGMMMPGMG
eukprot:CAMPEP_0197641392 /NCGR_PEP_ID=MMETSP1338-20131121/15377_1 /TAXON_ID=43686 ORGANISM="Pelagodinium beii, Strain RCC1491" /NCGR_SAMPLE_ID=MMETSP1338 /ASSEMBLY_ACC=CAM_ASM_000754 /LENGTH=200 /DNA_ID=CAMNT_0043214371 /DNA_START=80 /DNA_END=678 /DNA_ORIENTATION=+